VREAPGESMAALASRLAVPLRTLQRPMERLRQEGRVRSVGERSRMRYFPVPARASSGA